MERKKRKENANKRKVQKSSIVLPDSCLYHETSKNHSSFVQLDLVSFFSESVNEQTRASCENDACLTLKLTLMQQFSYQLCINTCSVKRV